MTYLTLCDSELLHCFFCGVKFNLPTFVNDDALDIIEQPHLAQLENGTAGNERIKLKLNNCINFTFFFLNILEC